MNMFQNTGNILVSYILDRRNFVLNRLLSFLILLIIMTPIFIVYATITVVIWDTLEDILALFKTSFIDKGE